MPTEVSPSGDIARRLLSCIGPAYQAPDNSHNASDALTFGDAFADLYTNMLLCMNESWAGRATSLLSELEDTYGLTVRTDLSVTARRNRLLAKIRAGRAGTPQNILRATDPYDPTATVFENTAADVAATYTLGVYVWALRVVAAAFDDAISLAAIRIAIEQLEPAHTLGTVTTQVGFYCDDPLSLLDRTVLG